MTQSDRNNINYAIHCVEYYIDKVCPTESAKSALEYLRDQLKEPVYYTYEEMKRQSKECYDKEYASGEYCHEQSFLWGFEEGVNWCEKQRGIECDKMVKIAVRKEFAEQFKEFGDTIIRNQIAMINAINNNHSNKSCAPKKPLNLLDPLVRDLW